MFESEVLNQLKTSSAFICFPNSYGTNSTVGDKGFEDALVSVTAFVTVGQETPAQQSPRSIALPDLTTSCPSVPSLPPGLQATTAPLSYTCLSHRPSPIAALTAIVHTSLKAQCSVHNAPCTVLRAEPRPDEALCNLRTCEKQSDGG